MTIQANQGFGVSVFGAVSSGGGGGGTPGGSNTQVQFNSSGSFGASANLTFVSPALTIGAQQTTQGQIVFANTAAGAFATTVQSSNSASAAWTLTLPATAGTANYALTTNGSGVSSWSQISLTAGVTGVLPLANGGTGTSTTFTAGSVIFAGASGIYSQNNSNLFWDSTNSRLGIGSSSPAAKIQIKSSDSSLIALISGGTNGVRIGADATSGSIEAVDQSGSASYQPLAIGGALLQIKVSGAEKMRVDASGNCLIGTTTAGTLLTVNGVATLCSGTATPAAGSTSARLLFGTTAGFGIYYGSGAPTVSAAQGSIYLRSDGSSTSTRLYVNSSSGSGTTWTNVTTAA